MNRTGTVAAALAASIASRIAGSVKDCWYAADARLQTFAGSIDRFTTDGGAQ